MCVLLYYYLYFLGDLSQFTAVISPDASKEERLGKVYKDRELPAKTRSSNLQRLERVDKINPDRKSERYGALPKTSSSAWC